MKNQYKHLSFLMAGLFISSVFFSCKKFVAIPAPVNKISTSAVFADSANAASAILGLYINAMGSNIPILLHGGITYSTALASDELSFTPGSPTGNQYDEQFYTNSISPQTNVVCNYFWVMGYNLIYGANACLEGVTASNGLSEPLKNAFNGELKFFRAWCYFNLVNLYGPVPLITTTDYKLNATLGRAPVDSIYAQMIADLIDARELMPDKYPSAGRARPNKAAATALLAKVYLYQHQWDKAEEMASQVINNTAYKLEPDLSSVFLTGSQEAILQLSPIVSGYETTDGNIFVPTTSDVIPSYVVDSSLLASFEPGDLRHANWLDSNVVDGIVYYYPYKYKLGYDQNSSPNEMYMILRLGDLYLIRAEARAQQGQDLTGAANDLDKIRNRSGLSNTSATDKPSLLDAIDHERQIELFCENGNRWFDLKRTGRIDQVMNVVAPWKGTTWNTNYQLFPVPFQELRYNPHLTQNNGY